MAYSRKRPTGGYGVSQFNAPSKAMFEETVKMFGFTCAVEKRNVGEWNEGRSWSVNGVTVEFSMKGETPDWAAMMLQVESMAKEARL